MEVRIFLLLLCAVIAIDYVHSREYDEPANKPKKLIFRPPKIPQSALFWFFFQAPSDLAKFVQSRSKKHNMEGKVAHYTGYWSVEIPESAALQRDYALVMKSRSNHHALATRFKQIIDFTKINEFVLQYEVKFQIPLTCGGAYLKLLSRQRDIELSEFNDQTPYSILFGPDKCGDENKIHFIFRYKNLTTGKFEEKRAKPLSSPDLAHYFTDKKTHLFTLVLRAKDDSFTVYVDQVELISGSLLTDVVRSPEEEAADLHENIEFHDVKEEHIFRQLVPVEALGLELWTLTDEVAFDNFLIVTNKSDADLFAAQTWLIKSKEEANDDSLVQSWIESGQKIARSNPWLFGVVLTVLAVPVLMVFMLFCQSAGGLAARQVVGKRQATPLFPPELLASLSSGAAGVPTETPSESSDQNPATSSTTRRRKKGKH